VIAWGWSLFGALFLGWFFLLCLLGVVCHVRDRREPSLEEENRDRHRKARAYARGEVIKHGGGKA
jgi:hypothetical protein